jgi:hypothetical protein
VVHVDILRRPVATYVVIGLVLGVLSLILALAKVTGLGMVFNLLIAATAFAAGYAARIQAGHPAWSGAAAGLAYGVASGFQAFLRKVTASQLKAALEDVHRSNPLSTSQLLAIVNSPGAHVGSLLLSAVLYALAGLVLGAIGGAIAGGRGARRRAA